MSTPAHITTLRSLSACEDGIEFAEQFDSIADAWEQCQRADWMVWLLCREPGSADPQRIKRVCVEFLVRVCREMPLPDGRKHIDLMADPRSVAAVEMAEKWLKGEATQAELTYAAHAAHAAYAAAYAAYATAHAADATVAHAAYAAYAAAHAAADAAHAAHAAAHAAYAAYAAAHAAADAAHAAHAAAHAAADAAHAAARSWQADIIRELIGNPYKEVYV